MNEKCIEAWISRLDEMLSGTFGDGNNIMAYVLAMNPELKHRMIAALNHKITEDECGCYSGSNAPCLTHNKIENKMVYIPALTLSMLMHGSMESPYYDDSPALMLSVKEAKNILENK